MCNIDCKCKCPCCRKDKDNNLARAIIREMRQNVHIEPKILSYARKAQYYKDHGIDPPLSLRSMYGITNDDLELIGKIERGEKIVVNNQTLNEKLTKMRSNWKFTPRFSGELGRNKYNFDKQDPILNRGLFYSEKNEYYSGVGSISSRLTPRARPSTC